MSRTLLRRRVTDSWGADRLVVERLESRRLLAAAPAFEFAASQYATPEHLWDQSGFQQPAMVTVVRNGDVNTYQTVYIETAATGGSATPNGDYTQVFPTQVGFQAGQRSARFPLYLADDGEPEADETVPLRLYAAYPEPWATPVLLDSATLTIYDDDNAQPPAVRFAADAFAGDESFYGGERVVDVVRTGTRSGAVGATLSARPQQDPPAPQRLPPTSAGANDFSGFDGADASFAAGQTATRVAVDVVHDGEPELDEAVPLVLTPFNGVPDTAPRTGTFTILDDDGGTTAPRLSAADVSVIEGNPTAAGKPVNLTVTLSRTFPYAAYVQYEVPGYYSSPPPANAAQPYGDFTPTSGYVQIPAGATSATVQVATTVPDGEGEPDETFPVYLFNPSYGVLLEDSEVTVTIVDDEPSFSIGDAVAFEGNTHPRTVVQVPVTLSQAMPYATSVRVEPRSDPEGAQEYSDFVLLDRSVTFAAGQTTKNVRVEFYGDAYVEADESFTLELVQPTYPIGVKDGRGTVTIRDDDGPPKVSIEAPPALREGNNWGEPGAAEAAFTVRLDRPATRYLSVRLQALSEGAREGEDFYAGWQPTVTFDPGATQATFGVQLFGDDYAEPDESFGVRVLPGYDYDLAPGGDDAVTARTTILDDDRGGHFAAATRVVSNQSEGSTLRFHVTRDHGGEAASVQYATANGTATAGADYTAASGTLQFAAGEYEKFVDVPLLVDGGTEPDETFEFRLSNPTGASSIHRDFVKATGVVVDVNGPERFRVALMPGNPVEGTPGDTHYAEFEVRLQGTRTSGAGAATVAYGTADGTAKAGQDYTARTGTLTFSAANSVQYVRVPLLDDGLYEGATAETFNLNLTGSNRSITTAAATAAIRDDEPAIGRVKFAQAAYSVGEAAGTATATVTFTPTPVAPGVTVTRPSTVSVYWQTSTAASPAATPGSDYTKADGTLTFPIAGGSQTISVALTNDSAVEQNEAFRLFVSPTATTPSGVFIGATGGQDDTVVTIVDDEAAQPPAVTKLFVSSSGWSTAFKSHLATSNQGESAFGFAIDPAAAVDELPWTNLDSISVRFDRPVTTSSASMILNGLKVANYPVVSSSYDANTRTATWRFATFTAADKLRVRLQGVTAATGGTAMSTAAGTFRLNVLPGDANRSGSVSATDTNLVKLAQGAARSTSLYTVFKDVNGSGTIMANDVNLVRGKQGTTLPAGTFPASLTATTTATTLTTTSQKSDRVTVDELRTR